MTEYDSTSDQRVENNTFRHEYRTLTLEEKTQMTRVKDLGFDFLSLLQGIGQTGQSARLASRELSLAQTKMEEAVFWAVKHITN